MFKHLTAVVGLRSADHAISAIVEQLENQCCRPFDDRSDVAVRRCREPVVVDIAAEGEVIVFATSNALCTACTVVIFIAIIATASQFRFDGERVV